jgi:hypothetical protein
LPPNPTRRIYEEDSMQHNKHSRSPIGTYVIPQGL